jgi:multisubunit Na+/H+ antiporter MnhB subunit
MEVLQARFRPILIAILVVGLGSALLIFLFAELAPANPLGDPGESKMYVHDMVLYGGKTNMVLGEFSEWLGSLWHGKRFAFTIAVLTLVLAAAFYYFFAPLPDADAGIGSDEQKEGNKA